MMNMIANVEINFAVKEIQPITVEGVVAKIDGMTVGKTGTGSYEKLQAHLKTLILLCSEIVPGQIIEITVVNGIHLAEICRP
jgi:hypothetical protein